MKKFNLMIAGAIIFYLTLAIAVGIWLRQEQGGSDFTYKVEINRIMNQITQEALHENNSDWIINSLEKIDLQNCEYVKEARFIELSSMKDTGESERMLLGKNEMEYELRPYIYNGETEGYVQIFYTTDKHLTGTLAFMETVLFLMAAVVLCALLYIRQTILLPFIQFSKLPYELAKGHLKEPIKENRSRYFGKFIWGLSVLQDQLALNKKKELKLEKEKKLMILSLSHDIKTPLNSIKLYAKALDEGLYESREQRQKAYGQIGKKCAEIEIYMKEIVKSSSENILDIEVKKGAFYLSELMKQLCIHYEEKCRLQHITFSVGEFTDKILVGDIDRTYEAIENIIENAMKYGDGRRIDITFSEEEYCQLIAIHNTGETVSDQEFYHLFDSFYRGSNAEGKEGSGLGLYICKEIMQKMEGDVFATRCEEGMTVTLVIPE